jgi:hypothetical protein
MNLLSLVEYLRVNILHDTGGTGVDWSSLVESDYDSIQLRWSNEELTRNINEAITQVYRRIQPIQDVVPLELIAGEGLYKLDPSILKILKVRSSIGREMIEADLADVWFQVGQNETPPLLPTLLSPVQGRSQTARNYSTNYSTGHIWIYPSPTIDETVSLLVYRFPLKKLTWDKNTLSPELREEYQIPMLWYAAFLCYMKDEANTIDPSRATLCQREFDKEFPFASVYANVRKSRTSNRSVKYGGF